MTSLFDVLADGSNRTYFDELDESAGLSTATANSAVVCSCSAAGIVLGAATANSLWTATAASVSGNSVGTANAAVVINGANVPNQTLVYIPPCLATVEIFGFSSQNIKAGVSTSNVVISVSAAAVTPRTNANAAVTITASAQALCFGVASASVAVNGQAAGNNVDISTSPAVVNVVILASASPRQLATAAASVALQASATGTVATLIGQARASVSISATAAEAAGVTIFPHADATVSITCQAVGAVVAAPVHATIPVVGKSIDFKTIADAYNAQQPPVPEYEFGYGKARRTFKQTGT